MGGGSAIFELTANKFLVCKDLSLIISQTSILNYIRPFMKVCVYLVGAFSGFNLEESLST